MEFIQICLLLSVIVYVARSDDIKCPFQFCKCTNFEAICSGKYLTYIPRLPRNIRKVTFLNGNITTLSGGKITNLTFNVIEILRFINNNIVRLEPDAFSSFMTIKALTISSEPSLLAKDVMNVLNNMKTEHLKSLNISDNNWGYLPNDMFKSIKKDRIHYINLKKNSLRLLNLTWFSNMPALRFLKVSFNKIATILLDSVPNLKSLNLDSNVITNFPKLCINHGNKSALPNLRKLSLSNNRIEHIGEFRCFPRLFSLKMDDNSIERIDYNTFAELKKLTNLSLQATGKPLKKIEDGAFNFPLLKMLSLRNCRFHFDRLSLSAQRSMLSNCKDIRFLDLSWNYIKSNILGRMISQLQQLRYLNLENTRLTFLPSNAFPELPVIETLIMRMNRIYGWDIDVFAHLTSLQYLDLRHNLIKIINESSFPTTLLENLKTIGLGTNQFACTCEQIWFVNWLRHTNITLLEYPKQYFCTTPDNYDGKLLKDFKPSYLSCNQIVTIVTSTTAFVCLWVLIMTIFLKCNTNIKNLLYLLKVKQFRRQGYLPILNSEDYQYHAFVVYCDENRMWVHNDFVKKLENEEGFKLCIHHRDFDVGESISGNVDKYLKKSWKVVVIISNAFAKSEWCQWEVDIIQERRRRQGRNALLLVMLENVTSKNMTSPLRTLLDSTPHLRYNNGIGENLFWSAVIADLRKPVGQPPVSEL
ncbi:toll-like receptor 1 [Mytilus galloprovincialis]|uniref:toll-like receptor 1 n=1 Tax=Mytilus galloprovincialis TaxID=29158 RepID=UPI003F7B8602